MQRDQCARFNLFLSVMFHPAGVSDPLITQEGKLPVDRRVFFVVMVIDFSIFCSAL
jgi:hypothetical protein